MKILEYIVNRLSEASTWKGLLLIVTATGVQMSPEKSAAIISVGLSVVGLINVFLKEVGSPDSKVQTVVPK